LEGVDVVAIWTYPEKEARFVTTIPAGRLWGYPARSTQWFGVGTARMTHSPQQLERILARYHDSPELRLELGTRTSVAACNALRDEPVV
jgi:hypothetical protein